MKYYPSLPLLFLAVAASLLAGCASSAPKPPPPPAPAAVGSSKSDGKSIAEADGKSVKSKADDLDEYTTAAVYDPWEPVNRVTFRINDVLYTIVLRPISKTYQFVVPKPARQGVYNAFENVKFPIRFVNDTLQGNFKRAGQETGKFLVNTVVGVGGLGRPSDHIPALADVPAADTGQTFAKWGLGNGPYFVLPLLGPSTVRDTVGLAGDYALNPITWVTFIWGGFAWTVAVPCTNTLRALPNELSQYDTATKNSLDKYLAARSTYLQYRKEINSR